MRDIRHTRWLAAIGVLLVAALPGAATASCAVPVPVPEAARIAEGVRNAEVVIVGTVGSTENQGRSATIVVEEIWKGRDLPSIVVVQGAQAGNAVTSGDRMFETGMRYLFTLAVDENGELIDNACSATTAWNGSLDGLRPAGARVTGREPDAAGFDFGGLLAPIGVAVIVGSLLLLAGLVARGRRAD